MDYMKNNSVLVLASGAVFYGTCFGRTPPTVTEFSKIIEDVSKMQLHQNKNVLPEVLQDKVLRNDAVLAINTQTNYFAGELIFNTAMSGYVEVLSDPSFTGQLVCMTYPHIGNYGVELEWSESGHQYAINAHTKLRTKEIMAAGFIVKDLYQGPVQEGRITLDNWMKQEKICGISGIDTRALTLHLREHGAENAAIIYLSKNLDAENLEREFALEMAEARALVQSLPSMEGRDLVQEVALKEQFVLQDTFIPQNITSKLENINALKVGILDYGCKHNIIRLFEQRNCSVHILPDKIDSQTILDNNFDVILVSNGPGDPSVLTTQLQLITQLLGKVTVCGICLGTQLLAQSIGAKTYKLPFGHHGVNHPVRNELDKKLYITSQNHGFAVDEQSLPTGCKVWFRNTNDNTLEGFMFEEKFMYSVQFHPEAAPGPIDTQWIIDYFLARAKENLPAREKASYLQTSAKKHDIKNKHKR